MKLGVILVTLVLASCGSVDPKNGNNANNQNNTSNNANNTSNNANNQNNSINASDYDQSCTMDPDCLLVSQTCCGCGDGAINDQAQPDFTSARTTACANVTECPPVACEEKRAVCGDDGLCRADSPIMVVQGQFDTFCEGPQDCFNVESDPCSACRCGGILVGVNGIDAYNELAEEADCNPGPSPCDCAPSEVTCNENNECEFAQ